MVFNGASLRNWVEEGWGGGEAVVNLFLRFSCSFHCCCSTFGCNDFSEKQLQQAVSQLNHNMLHLCFSQGVDESSLISRHTMHNLLLLLRSEHLGE